MDVGGNSVNWEQDEGDDELEFELTDTSYALPGGIPQCRRHVRDLVACTKSWDDTETIQGVPIKRLLILEHCGQSRIACSPLDEYNV